MATCGYICPKCDGKGFLEENLADCDWCKKPTIEVEKVEVEITDEEWIKAVHEKNCCAD